MASSQTTNYSLPQWSKSDRIQMSDFNAAMSTIDAALAGKSGVTFGTYTGNGAASRTISLGFTPKAVYTCTRSGLAGALTGSYYTYGGLAFPGNPVKCYNNTAAVEVVEGGFTVRQTNDYDRVNYNGTVYHYIAFR